MPVMLVDRDAEIATIREALGAAADGHGHLLMLDGPAGIGKTSLLRTFCDEARADGTSVLRARGSPVEVAFPLPLVLEVCEPALDDEDDRERALAGEAAEAQAVFGPVVADGAH